MTNAQGKTEEFLKAYDELSDALFRHCYYRCYDRERAKELMQECFVRAWEYVVEGKEIKNLKAFLYRVANNLVIDESRKKKESSLDVLMDAGFEPRDDKDQTVTNAEAGQMMRLLDRIDEKYRRVVAMRYLDDLSPKEIAIVMGESENVVSVRLYRGIRQLRDLMASP
jgi:RNA polymerase sigma-70 factor (ECF subfamily)